MSKKVTSENIDEKSLLASIYAKKSPIENISQRTIQQKPEESNADSDKVEVTQSSKEKGGRKKRKESEDYESIYLQKKELKTRQCVYISLNVHKKIQKIVRSFANQEITVGGYIDTVLMEHLETNKEEINELYRKFKEENDTII